MPGRPLFRFVLKIAVVLAALRVVGHLVSRQYNIGDDASDNFSLAAVFGGTDRAGRAASLRRGDVLACCGGVQLDLREATLDPAGADLRLRAYMGGIQVVVPQEWRVVMEADAKAGGIDTNVTADDLLSADAPVLRVHATAAMGGVQVTTDADAGGGAGEGALDSEAGAVEV